MRQAMGAKPKTARFANLLLALLVVATFPLGDWLVRLLAITNSWAAELTKFFLSVLAVGVFLQMMDWVKPDQNSN
jgi:hypothetical protein